MTEEIRYALARYSYDLSDPKAQLIPVGVLVVDEKVPTYVFNYLSLEELPAEYQPEGEVSVGLWLAVPDALHRKFCEYQEKPNHQKYMERIGEEHYHGFISQVVHDWERGNFHFSNSEPIERTDTINELVEQLFNKKVIFPLQKR